MVAGERALAARDVTRSVSGAAGAQPGSRFSGARHADGRRADDVTRRGGTLLGAHTARVTFDGGYQRYFLRVAGLKPFLGSESACRTLDCADRQRVVLYFSVVWHAQQAGG